MMTNEDELRSLSATFYDAVNAVFQGDAGPMLALWSQADEASYCDTRGQIVRGWPALEAYWRRAAELNARAPGGLRATGEVQQIVVGGELGYVVAVERVRRDGESGVMTARATNIYRRETDGWRLLHRHADAPPTTTSDGTVEEQR
jgi:ketosteroid isomerase-like protein